MSYSIFNELIIGSILMSAKIEGINLSLIIQFTDTCTHITEWQNCHAKHEYKLLNIVHKLQIMK